MNNLDELANAFIYKIRYVKNLSLMRDIIKQYEGKDWKDKCNFANDTYQRIKIFGNNDFEIYILCWSPNQKSPIHDHPENGCLLKVLQGTLAEERYTIAPKIKLIKKINITSGNVSYIDNSLAYHRIHNDSPENSVTLHVYSPPLYEPKNLDHLLK